MSEHDQIERVIDDAAAALREETEKPVSELEAARTRARILATHRRERERASRAATWLAAAAALMIVLGGSTAWAYWTGRLDAWLGTSATHEEETPVPPPTTVHDRVTPPPTTTTVVTAPIVAAETESTTVTPSAPPEVVEAASTTEPEAIERTPVDPRERAAYRAAHALHFDEHDPARAIDAWDAYLRAYPSGRFALEARYNRALCLVRLGRTGEAREALAPFVAGTHGGYRQQEATQLVEALGAQ